MLPEGGSSCAGGPPEERIARDERIGEGMSIDLRKREELTHFISFPSINPARLRSVAWSMQSGWYQKERRLLQNVWRYIAFWC